MGLNYIQNSRTQLHYTVHFADVLIYFMELDLWTEWKKGILAVIKAQLNLAERKKKKAMEKGARI